MLGLLYVRTLFPGRGERGMFLFGCVRAGFAAVAAPVGMACVGSGLMGFGSCCTGGSEVVVRGLGCPEAREIRSPRPGV